MATPSLHTALSQMTVTPIIAQFSCQLEIIRQLIRSSLRRMGRYVRAVVAVLLVRSWVPPLLPLLRYAAIIR